MRNSKMNLFSYKWNQRSRTALKGKEPGCSSQAESHQQVNSCLMRVSFMILQSLYPLLTQITWTWHAQANIQRRHKSENLSINYNIEKIQKFRSLKEIQALGTYDPTVTKAFSE